MVSGTCSRVSRSSTEGGEAPCSTWTFAKRDILIDLSLCAATGKTVHLPSAVRNGGGKVLQGKEGAVVVILSTRGIGK